MDINLLLQVVIAIIMLFSAILIYLTLKNNKDLNQRILFNEIVRQERELRIKLSEYRKEINKVLGKDKEVSLDYDTLLFNYYEYLAICLYNKLINEKFAKLYFRNLLDYVKDLFDNSILFSEQYSKKKEYPGIRWLFRKWDID